MSNNIFNSYYIIPLPPKNKIKRVVDDTSLKKNI